MYVICHKAVVVVWLMQRLRLLLKQCLYFRWTHGCSVSHSVGDVANVQHHVRFVSIVIEESRRVNGRLFGTDNLSTVVQFCSSHIYDQGKPQQDFTLYNCGFTLYNWSLVIILLRPRVNLPKIYMPVDFMVTKRQPPKAETLVVVSKKAGMAALKLNSWLQPNCWSPQV